MSTERISVHSLGPSGRCCCCDQITRETRPLTATVGWIPLVMDSYLEVEVSLCEGCKRGQPLFKPLALGFAAGGAAVAATIAVLGEVDPDLLRHHSNTISFVGAALCFAIAIAWLWMSRRRSPQPRLSMQNYDEKTGSIDVEAPFPKNLTRAE